MREGVWFPEVPTSSHIVQTLWEPRRRIFISDFKLFAMSFEYEAFDRPAGGGPVSVPDDYRKGKAMQGDASLYDPVVPALLKTTKLF